MVIKAEFIPVVNGRLVQVGSSFRCNQHGSKVAVFECECGIRKVMRIDHIRTGDSVSCGCLSSEIVIERNLKHSLSKTVEYKIWTGMKNRCLNQKSKPYHRYGGRGITICDRWLNSFENFLEDMGKRPEGLSLERVRNNEGYGPDNCKWATCKEQGRNRRTNVLITICGKTQCIVKWAEESGVSHSMISQRIKRGKWTPEDAVFTPAGAVRKSLQHEALDF